MTFIMTFHDIPCALEAEKAFKQAGVPCELDSVPPELGLSCGYAIRCEAEDAFAILELQKRCGVKAVRTVPVS